MKKKLNIMLISIVILISGLNILTFTNYEKLLINGNSDKNIDIDFIKKMKK